MLIPLLVVCVQLLCVLGEGTHGENGVVNDSPQARRIFHLEDADGDYQLSHAELHSVFLKFDTDGDNNVTVTEFVSKWLADGVGVEAEARVMFANLDVNRDNVINELIDMPIIFIFFDRDRNGFISQGEFVIQWVKIST